MIDVSGHLRSTRREIGFEDYTKPLVINCCGYQTFEEDDFTRQRPAGRLDYQLIYLYKGYGEYFIKGTWLRMPAGSLILYRPGEPQIYTYHGKDSPEIYWVHFTGNDCTKLLEKHNIKNSEIGENLPIKNLFQEMILELQLKKNCYEDIVCNNFLKLTALIHRTTAQKERMPDYNFALDYLIIQLNQYYMNDWNIRTMAEFCHLSEDYFSHYFKKILGLSPMQYLTLLRVEKARELLLWENRNIGSVAAQVGYGDPLYFSRVFKKITGCSPKAYRKNHFL